MQSCTCQHNTCGDSCETCCPLYNQHPWKAGTSQDAAKCEPCQCHGHADSCDYDAEVARNRLSINTKGEKKGGGVCVNCRVSKKMTYYIICFAHAYIKKKYECIRFWQDYTLFTRPLWCVGT